MSFVNYSIILENAHLFSIEKQFLPFSGKEVHYNQLKAIFPCFSGFDVFRMALNVEERAVRLWGPVEEGRALQLGALAASSSVLMKPLATDDTVMERSAYAHCSHRKCFQQQLIVKRLSVLG